jgi:DtxR family Mn-dependent transcriptional regulator
MWRAWQQGKEDHSPQCRKPAIKVTDAWVATVSKRRRRLVELFLQQILGYGWGEVHEEAERLEHVVSDTFIERLDTLLNYPDKDPHGEAIPDAQGFRTAEDDVCLAEAGVGEYTIRRVTGGEPRFLAYLEKAKLVPGKKFVLLEKAPFQGPLKVLVSGIRTANYIGLEAAKRIYVSQAQSQKKKLRN